MDQSNPFEGIKGTTAISDISATDRIRMAILGQPGSGKSWFAATAPGPTLIYDFDNRKESLERFCVTTGRKDIHVKTLVDTNPKSPSSIKAIETDISMFQYRKAKGLPIPNTFIFDSVTHMVQAMRNEIFAQDPKLARQVKVAPATLIQLNNGWDVINGIQGLMRYLIGEFSSLGNLIMVFHEMEEKDKGESKPDKPVYTGKVTINPQFLLELLTLYNEVFRIEVVGGVAKAEPKYIVTTKPTADVNAKTTLAIDMNEPPNLMDMIAKHKANLAKQLTTK
jgi:hypothetical protein